METYAEFLAEQTDKGLRTILRQHMRELKGMAPGIVRQDKERLLAWTGQEIGRRAWAKYWERRRKEAF